jgi:hypothetical protein
VAYLNMDDNYPDNPKVKPLSNAAYRLHGSAMFYAAKWLLDGYLTPPQMRDLKGYTPATLRELIAADLVHDRGLGCGTKTCLCGLDGAYLLHDFLQWNKPRTWWEKKRIDDAERLAKWRAEQAAKEQTNKGDTHA